MFFGVISPKRVKKYWGKSDNNHKNGGVVKMAKI